MPGASAVGLLKARNKQEQNAARSRSVLAARTFQALDGLDGN
jgi:hypothetical protein